MYLVLYSYPRQNPKLIDTLKTWTSQDYRQWPQDPQSTFVPLLAVCLFIIYIIYILPFILEASSSLPLPAVLTAPIRLDVVQQVHSKSLELNHSLSSSTD